MEQRQHGLGDVLDDYCPRERRVTNHAVVALVGDEIKLTRCTTCDTEHPYKAARVPPRRQTRLVAALSSASAASAPALQGPADAEAAVLDLIATLDNQGEGVLYDELRDDAVAAGIDAARLDELLDSLNDQGLTYQPAFNRFRVA